MAFWKEFDSILTKDLHCSESSGLALSHYAIGQWFVTFTVCGPFLETLSTSDLLLCNKIFCPYFIRSDCTRTLVISGYLPLTWLKILPLLSAD